ncbi:PHP-associated domain-containing protein [Candidatus Poriferisodalis sp.]|uniref:PHP-associated domain-containing protein n=1 Tax=Candidatus Poriferisodalis sp. TaxID=3101277 RepID=UPI003B012DB2
MPRPAAPAALERHPHLAQDCPAGWVRVDFHTHTMWSGDSTTTPDEFATCLAESGIDVVCITDHNAVRGAQRLQDELDARVVVGEEMKTHAGEIIGLFLTERVPQGLAPAAAARAVKSQGGLVYIPHPFDPLRNNLRRDVLDELVGEGLVDGIEVLNAKTSLSSLNSQAARYACEHGLAPGAGSDAHVAEALGGAYLEMPDFGNDDPAGFLWSMRQGRAVGHHYDPPRRWKPRIVPSVGNDD